MSRYLKGDYGSAKNKGSSTGRWREPYVQMGERDLHAATMWVWLPHLTVGSSLIILYPQNLEE